MKTHIPPPKVCFVDTSAFYAIENKNCKEHKEALGVAGFLEENKAILVTTDYVLDETYTLLRFTLGHGVAVAFGEEIRKGGIEIVQVDESLQERAWEIFKRYKDKRFSFTDCTSFAVMERAGIETAFSFDRDFRQYGFLTLPLEEP